MSLLTWVWPEEVFIRQVLKGTVIHAWSLNIHLCKFLSFHGKLPQRCSVSSSQESLATSNVWHVPKTCGLTLSWLSKCSSTSKSCCWFLWFNLILSLPFPKCCVSVRLYGSLSHIEGPFKYTLNEYCFKNAQAHRRNRETKKWVFLDLSYW